MSTTVVIGCRGQLGTDLLDLCRARGQEVIGLDLPEIDIGNAETTRDKLFALEPRVVINCAAYHVVDVCEDHEAEAMAINGEAPRQLARVCRELDAVLMHFSTDYVMGGTPLGRPWREDDRPEPQSAYARSKLRGERLVRETWEKHFVIRTCGLYGKAGSRPKGGNFVETMIRLGQGDKPLKVVSDQTVGPTATAELATALLALLGTKAFGLYHVTNSGACTWFEFAAEIFRLMELEPNLVPISSAEYGAKAKRPEYSILDNGKLAATGVTPLGSWQAALATYVRNRGNP